jgi:hypothetical protein
MGALQTGAKAAERPTGAAEGRGLGTRQARRHHRPGPREHRPPKKRKMTGSGRGQSNTMEPMGARDSRYTAATTNGQQHTPRAKLLRPSRPRGVKARHTTGQTRETPAGRARRCADGRFWLPHGSPLLLRFLACVTRLCNTVTTAGLLLTHALHHWSKSRPACIAPSSCDKPVAKFQNFGVYCSQAVATS